MMIFAKPQAGPVLRIALEDKKLDKFSMPASSTQPLKIVFELILIMIYVWVLTKVIDVYDNHEAQAWETETNQIQCDLDKW